MMGSGVVPVHRMVGPTSVGRNFGEHIVSGRLKSALPFENRPATCPRRRDSAAPPRTSRESTTPQPIMSHTIYRCYIFLCLEFFCNTLQFLSVLLFEKTL